MNLEQMNRIHYALESLEIDPEAHIKELERKAEEEAAYKRLRSALKQLGASSMSKPDAEMTTAMTADLPLVTSVRLIVSLDEHGHPGSRHALAHVRRRHYARYGNGDETRDRVNAITAQEIAKVYGEPSWRSLNAA